MEAVEAAGADIWDNKTDSTSRAGASVLDDDTMVSSELSDRNDILFYTKSNLAGVLMATGNI